MMDWVISGIKNSVTLVCSTYTCMKNIQGCAVKAAATGSHGSTVSFYCFTGFSFCLLNFFITE
jgi:hypothetical protein